MANFGASAGYLDFLKDQQQRDQQAMQQQMLRAQLAQYQQQQQQEARQRAARAQWGPLLGGMGQQPPQGQIPQPPMPGQSSQPAQPPQGAMPPQGMPQGGGIPPPPGAAPQGQPPAGPQAGPPGPPQPQGWKPMPTQPPPQAGAGAPPQGQIPPPPGGASAGGPPPPGGDTGGDQFSLQNIIGALKKNNVPPDQWADVLDTMPEPVKANAAAEIKRLHESNDAMYKWATINIKQQGADTADRKTDVSEKRADIYGKDVDSKIQDRLQRASIAKQKAAAGLAPSTSDLQDPETAQFWVDNYKATGKPPPFSFGKQGQKDRELFRKAVADDARANNQTGADVATGQAEFKGDSQALNALKKRNVGIDTGMKKIANDIKTLESYQPTGAMNSPTIINKPINALKTQFSDPKFAAYQLAAQQVGTEYERMLTGGMMSAAQLHAGAAEDAKKLINGDMSIAEINEKIKVMRKEMQNAKDAGASEEQELTGRMRGGAKKSGGDSGVPTFANAAQLKEAIAAKTVKKGDKFLDPDGNEHTVN